MPYKITNETSAQTSWMEKCIKGVLKNRKFKSRDPKESRKTAAIKVCKEQMSKKKNPVKGMRTMADAFKRAGIR